MALSGALSFCLPRATYRRHALAALGHAFSHAEARRIWGQATVEQRDLKRTRPHHSPGTNLILRYMEWNAALFRALVNSGVPESKAQHLVQEITWAAIKPLAATSFGLTRLASRSPVRRTGWTYDLMFRTLFTRPFKRTTYPVSDREAAFDVTACPIAAYFNSHGLAELTPWAACSMDERMAAMWGVTLTRPQTIAAGHPLCDFRFRLPGASSTRDAGTSSPAR